MWSVPKSRGRKKPNKNRRSNQPRGRRSAERELEATYRQTFDELDQIARGADPLDAETLVSMLCGDGWQTGDLGGNDHESLEAVLEAAGGRTRAAGGVALARAVAAMAPTAELAARAQRVSADLIARGAPEPTWSADLDQVTAVGCWVLRDVYGDGASVLCSFERAGRRHGLSVMVDFNHLGGWAKDVLLSEDVDDMLALMHQGAQEAGPGIMFVEEMDPGAARRLLEDAFAATDSTWEPEVSSDFADLRALALHRLAVLPEPPERTGPVEVSDDERTEIVREFLAAPEAADLSSIGDPEYCARLIVDYGADYDDGKLLRVSPAKIDIFLLGWLPKKVVLDADDRALMPHVLPAWVRWSARRQGLPPAAVDELLEFTRICVERFDEAYDDVANMSPGRALLEGLNLDEDEDLQDALDRRRFAMPYVGARIGDEDFDGLNPDDPDERSLLIEGEHPEYHEALADPTFEGEIDGVRPRLHLVMHEIVANQLWDNDPPEVWAAARRLLDAGHDRHDILHAIGHAFMPLVHSSLVDRKSFDAAAYRTELNKLGR